MTNGEQGVPLKQKEPGTYWFRVGFFVVTGVLLLWLVSSFLYTWLYPRDWILTVNQPAEKTGFSRAFAAAGFREAALHAHPGYARPTFVDMVKEIP